MFVVEELPSGSRVKERYLIQARIGQGGFSRTYLANDQRASNKTCVLKEFAPINISADTVQKAQELFQREAEILSNLAHSQIPQFNEWFEEQGRFFIVQEFIEGKTYAELLKERQEENRTFSEIEILEWLQDLLSVLNYIHERGVLHRDIAPDNIMLSSTQDQPMLIDFGVARQVATELQESRQSKYNTGVSTVVHKSGGYSAPELQHSQCFPSSDLYSLAVTTIVLLTGKSPGELFDAYDNLWKWQAYVQITRELEVILKKMLEAKPKDRYQSVDEVIIALNKISASQSVLYPTEISIAPSEIIPKLKSRNIKKIISIPLFILFITIGVFVTRFLSPYIEFLCEPLRNCFVDPKDQEFTNQYNELTKKATFAQKRAQNSESLEQLQNSIGSLREVLYELESIPQQATIYSQVRTVLPNYKKQLSILEGKLKMEEKAQEFLNEAEKISQDASELTRKAEFSQNLNQLKEAREEWKKASEQIERIDLGTFVAREAKKLQLDYKTKIDSINQQIQTITAPPLEPPSPPVETTLPPEPPPLTEKSQPLETDPSSLPCCSTAFLGQCRPDC